MGDAESVSQLRRTWEAAAPGWAKWEPVWGKALAEATEAMIDAAGVTDGMHVLDVACGAGSQTLRAARRAGDNGQVVAADISATMLEYVRRTAAEAGLRNISTLEGAAEELELADSSFDAAICRLGLMLFAARAEAVAVIRRALKPGARFAALVFTTPANNSFMAAPMGVLLRHASTPPPSPGNPGLFALGGEGILAGLLDESGLADVRAAKVRATLRFDTVDDALHMFQEAAGAYRAVVANLNEGERARAWDEVRAGIHRFQGADGIEAELEFIIGSGARVE